MLGDQTIGTCSLCGGPVQVPVVWMAIVPPTPTCAHCGAHAAPNHGPVIPMQPAPPRTTRGATTLKFLEFSENTSGSRFVVEHEEQVPDPIDPLRRYL